MNKFTFFSIVATMWIMALFPVKAHADIVDVTVGNIIYEVNTGSRTASVKDEQFFDLSGAITIVNQVTYNGTNYPVTSIAENALSNRQISSVVIPESVTSIGAYAFQYCTDLTSVVIPQSVTKLNQCTFDNCWALADITLPSSMSNIASSCFRSIKNNAIINCQGSTPPTCVVGNGGSFDEGTLRQKTLLVPSGAVDAYKGVQPWSKMKVEAMVNEVTVDNIVYKLDNTAKVASVGSYQTSQSGVVTIASSVTANGTTYPVTSIARSAFEYCNRITSVIIPQGVTSIGYAAFYGCSAMTSIEIPQGVTLLEQNTFKQCTSLGSIILPGSLETIELQCFENIKNDAAITCYSLNPPMAPVDNVWDGVVVRPGAFQDATLGLKTLYVLPQAIDAYRATTPWSKMKVSVIEDVTVGDIAYKLDNTAMTASVRSNQSTSLSGAITIASSVTANGATYTVTSIGVDAFKDCKLITSVVIPQGVISIGEMAFYGCDALTSIEIPEGVTRLEYKTFEYCYALAGITLPSSLQSIDRGCFYGIKDNAIINCHNPNPPTCALEVVHEDGSNDIGAFDELLDQKTLLVPNEAIAAYRATEPWSKMLITPIGGFVSEVNVNNIVYTLDNETTTASVKTHQSPDLSGPITIVSSVTANGETYPVTSIANEAFLRCRQITFCDIPEGVTSIGQRTFLSCESMLSIVIPEGVTTLEPQIFAYCEALGDISLPSSLNTIKINSFQNVKKECTITCYNPIPPTITDIYETFYYNRDKTLYVPAQSVNVYKSTMPWSEMKVLPLAIVGGTPGDVDGDGVVDMNDVNVAINTMLGRTNTGQPDVNGDSTVDMADINIIINKMLGK